LAFAGCWFLNVFDTDVAFSMEDYGFHYDLLVLVRTRMLESEIWVVSGRASYKYNFNFKRGNLYPSSRFGLTEVGINAKSKVLVSSLHSQVRITRLLINY